MGVLAHKVSWTLKTANGLPDASALLHCLGSLRSLNPVLSVILGRRHPTSGYKALAVLFMTLEPLVIPDCGIKGSL